MKSAVSFYTTLQRKAEGRRQMALMEEGKTTARD
jgi:hypothetical protein